MLKPGMLIVFEGPDGSGKTTLAKLLEKSLTNDGIQCLTLAFPGNQSGTLGHHVYEIHHNYSKYNINNIDPASIQILHLAAHVDAIKNFIIPILERGDTIILDRFWWSMWVYGIDNSVDRESLELMIEIEALNWGNHLPSVAFLIERDQPLREDMSPDRWQKLKTYYYDIFELEKSKYPAHVITNDRPPEEALKSIIRIIKRQRSHRDLSRNNRRGLTRQLSLNLGDKKVDDKQEANVFTYTKLLPAIPTEVFNTFWYFAAERQNIFFKKLHGSLPPWTKDNILTKYKFTNAYRASDRVSQYLIKNVIYRGDQSSREVFFRILLFKIFNKIETWQLLQDSFGELNFSDFSFERFDNVLNKAMDANISIFSAAYIMPSRGEGFHSPKKHRNFLQLIAKMIDEEVHLKICDCRSMKDVFEILHSYPMMGDFLSYQLAIDINYSELTDFSESEFVYPGPGARDGLRKTFANFGGLNEIDIIRLMKDIQDDEFARLELNFRTLWGRPLQLIDCQNLFCEVDKYSRVAHPEIKGVSDRKRIKHQYKPKTDGIKYWYPPKWKINDLIEEEYKQIGIK
jgi:thymidylate kinase